MTATCVTYTYDANGNLTQRVDASGATTYTYDVQNRATAKTAGGTTTTVTYDGASNILTFTDPTGTVTYAYDAANLLVSLAEPGGSCPATPAFPNTTKCTGFEYDQNNRRTSTSYPNGVKNTTAYDNAGRITSITAAGTSVPLLAKRSYAYTSNAVNKEGALRKTMTTEATGDTTSTTTYSYDDRSRLTGAVNVTGAVTTTEAWLHDKNSNRTRATKGTDTAYSTYNGADQLCWTAATNVSCTEPPTGATTYAYDANGNTTTAGTATSAFNIFDQNTSTTTGGATTNFTYAGLRNDERTGTSTSAGSTSFLNGSLGITTQTTAGATTAFIRDPDGNLVSMRNSAGASFYYTTDALGSVILLTDSAQGRAATYAYDSWGNTTATGAQAAANPWQYAGGYKDATGYTKFGARYYNPAAGRFTQPDPSGQEQNRYAYAGANPITNIDPTGLSFEDFLGGVIESGITGVGGAILGLTKTSIPTFVLGAGLACVAGAIGGVVSARVDGDVPGWSDAGWGCATGLATYTIGAAGGAAVKAAKAL
ncbi:RHS repeat-associated core domain-containing protein [Arthrobacter sp. NPDC058288]|uniref:RHS repeat-associated core domain-containing protein n=1 Tax=Arthrobacter sp. NPDC058288 TaxID=3346424 RepID=UPI0036EB9E69